LLIAAAILHPLQCRMARAALGWSLDALAERACIDRKTILRFEQGESAMRARNLELLRRAFEADGVRFVDAGEHAGAVMPPPAA
jgi:transcriptional regulator with XRE-family HTH domain